MNNYLEMKKIVMFILLNFLMFLPVVSGLNDVYTLYTCDIDDKYYIKDIKYVDPKRIADTYISMSTSVAYIYSSDTTSAYSYKSLLDSNGFSTTLISMCNVDVTDFSEYSVIIMGSDTGYLSSWDDDTSVSNVEESDKPIIGLGEGGYAFFGHLKLETGHPNGWHGDEKSVYIMDSQNTIFLMPNEITIPRDKILQLYTSSGHVGIYLPSIPSNIIVLAREAHDKNHYSLTLEKDKYLLWGFTASPDSMTNVGSNLFINVVNYMISLSAPQSGTIEVSANLEDATFTISGPDFYSGSGKFWSQSDAPPGDYTITYGSVSGYKTPASETKTLSSGGSIIFFGDYYLKRMYLKRMVGESIDHGNGYISHIKKIDQEAGEVSMELQLDNRTINESILTIGDYYIIKKYNKKPCWYNIVDIDQENSGVYVLLKRPYYPLILITYFDLIVDSAPQGADILIDKEYIGKTPKKIPIKDFEMHILSLELNGYKDAERSFKFESNEKEKEITISLEEVKPTPTMAPYFCLNISSIPTGAEIFIDEKYVGKTPQKKIHISDFNPHSLRLALNGYETNETTFKFESDEEEKEITISLDKVGSTFGPTVTPTPTLAGGEGFEPTPTPTSTLPSITPSPITTPALLAIEETQKEPGFLAILAIVTILCGYLVVKKW